MMADLRDKLRRQIGQAAPGALPGGSRAALDDKLRGAVQEEAQRAALYAPVDVYLVTDGTSSMDYIIDAVRDGSQEISRELFDNPNKGDVRVSISVVRDHFDANHDPMDPFIQGLLRNTLDGILKDVKAIRSIANWDDAEGYECAWLELAREISQKKGGQGRKNVVVFSGDMIPHGLLANHINQKAPPVT